MYSDGRSQAVANRPIAGGQLTSVRSGIQSPQKTGCSQRFVDGHARYIIRFEYVSYRIKQWVF